MTFLPPRVLPCLGAIALASAGCAGSLPELAVPDASRVRAGDGYYSTWLVPGERPPATESGRPATPRSSPRLKRVPTTNDWWSSLIWQWRDGATPNPYSENLYAHPLTLRARADGFELGHPTEARVAARRYSYPHHADLVVGVEGLAAPAAQVDDYSDWTVTAALRGGATGLALTFGHGLPFAYASDVQGRARVHVAGAPRIIARADHAVAFSVGGRSYALFAPPGSGWTQDAAGFWSDLGGRGFFSVAALPEASPAVFELFRRHAFAFVRETRATWRYDRAGAAVETTLRWSSEPRETGPDFATTPLVALYRHQWTATSAELLPYRYASPRGDMKLAASDVVVTRHPISGLLPSLPDVGTHDRARLRGLLRIALDGEPFPPGLEGTRDSYWEGKSFGRLTELLPIARSLGEAELERRILDALETELEDWFDGRLPRYFYYDRTWRTLIGVPTMYHSGTQLNDHHFHYGYFVAAAAAIAERNPTWARRYQPFVDLLIADVANTDRADSRFPFLRYFDVYAGHSWATGTTFFPHGNNQESSSEDLNFAAAVARWGAATGRDELRDLGLFLHAVGSAAVAEYWYDVHGAVLPKSFGHPMVSLLWGDGGAYDTWFNYLPPFVQGIQLTPMSMGSLWLGRHPQRIDRMLEHLRRTNGGEVVIWRDLFWMLEALSQPDRAAARFEREHAFEPEFGNSLAHTYQFVENLRALGRLDPSVTADTPFHAVFQRAGKRTHVAFTRGPERVRFSDGTELRANGLSHDRGR